MCAKNVSTKTTNRAIKDSLCWHLQKKDFCISKYNKFDIDILVPVTFAILNFYSQHQISQVAKNSVKLVPNMVNKNESRSIEWDNMSCISKNRTPVQVFIILQNFLSPFVKLIAFFYTMSESNIAVLMLLIVELYFYWI